MNLVNINSISLQVQTSGLFPPEKNIKYQNIPNKLQYTRQKCNKHTQTPAQPHSQPLTPLLQRSTTLSKQRCKAQKHQKRDTKTQRCTHTTLLALNDLDIVNTFCQKQNQEILQIQQIKLSVESLSRRPSVALYPRVNTKQKASYPCCYTFAVVVVLAGEYKAVCLFNCCCFSSVWLFGNCAVCVLFRLLSEFYKCNLLPSIYPKSKNKHTTTTTAHSNLARVEIVPKFYVIILSRLYEFVQFLFAFKHSACVCYFEWVDFLFVFLKGGFTLDSIRL